MSSFLSLRGFGLSVFKRRIGGYAQEFKSLFTPILLPPPHEFRGGVCVLGAPVPRIGILEATPRTPLDRLDFPFFIHGTATESMKHGRWPAERAKAR